MAALLSFSEVTRLDSELVRLGRGAASVRLAAGEALDALSSSGGHHELGFSSLEAYARDAEVAWLERARKYTVRELRSLLADAGAKVDDDAADEPEATRTLTVRATREDGWMFECARKVADAVAGPMSPDRLIHALLAEGYSTLLELVPETALSELHDIDRLEHEVTVESEAHVAWRAELRRFRNDAEELCEARLPLSFESETPMVSETTVSGCLPPRAPEALDREIRRLCSELSAHDLAVGIVAEGARKAEVWRRLGFATETQYARERVGVSLSSLKAKRILAARAARAPELGAALASGRIGYEAAYLLSRIVTPATVEPWIRRAERRTVKHLREEVEAAELLVRMGQGRDQAPLDEASLAELFELERSIVSGDLFGRTGDTKAGDCSEREPTGTKDERGERWHAGQISGSRRAARLGQRFGRVTLRWLVKEQTYRFWRALERVFTRVSSRVCRARTSFLGFLCENFCRTWLPALRHERLTESGELPEYFHVFRRDAFRCTSPVCSRRDVTPHHLLFRSHGGGDEDENIASLCVWCHLHGVHEGRIGAEPPASRISWRIGRAGTLRIEGRTRVAA